MTTRITILLALLGTMAVAAGAVAAPGVHRVEPTAATWHPLNASYLRTHDIPSHHGAYRASLVFDQTAGRDGIAGRVVVVTSAGLPVTGARLSLEASMPDHESVAPVRLPVEELGHGAYRVGGMRFDRDGLWTVRLAIETRIDGDSLAFNVIR